MAVVDGAAHLAQLAVLPEYAGEGLGTRLVGAAIDWARTRRLPALTLTTFREIPFNAPWYARLGFHPLAGGLGPELRAVWDDEADLRAVAPRVALALDLGGPSPT